MDTKQHRYSTKRNGDSYFHVLLTAQGETPEFTLIWVGIGPAPKGRK